MIDWIGTLNYIRGDVCCVIILLYCMVKFVKEHRKTAEGRCFTQLILWMVLYIVMYSMSGTFKYNYMGTTAGIYNFVVMLIMVSQTMVAYKWFCYSEMCQNSGWIASRKWQVAVFLPVGIFCLIAVMSMWTKWIFFIDNDLTYNRGKLFLLQYLLVATYMGVTSIKALLKSRMKENYVHRDELYTLFTFIIPPAITTALQAITPMGVFMVGFGFTISIIMVYLNNTQEQVSQDGLTKLNNRIHMSHFLSTRMFEENSRLYLLIIDANSFKGINDTYGHIEGDKALIRIANTLMAVARKYSCYVSRYGGDEFIAIYEADAENQVEELCSMIHEQLDIENQKADAPYQLTVSVGYSRYTDKIKNIPDFIEAADRQLMKKKEEIHGRKANARKY